jgi:hypothetical protein
MKKQLTERFKMRLKLIMKTHLSALNKVKAVNSFAVPAITYSFGILKWTTTELEELNRVIRTTFTKYRAHHPKACKERFHLSRSKGGRGITDLRARHKNQIDQLRAYFHKTALQTNIYAAIVNTDKKLTPLNLHSRQLTGRELYTEDQLMNQWMSKELHGRHPHLLQQAHIDQQASVAWLTQGNVFVETEGFMCAIQDQVMATRSYRSHIIKDPNLNTTKCRMCGDNNETIEHIISGCRVLAPKEYINRHNNVAKIIHIELGLKYGYVTEKQPYYRYTPQEFIENERCKVYWDKNILTDRTTPHNKPDICLLDKTENKVYLIEVAIPAPANVDKKHREKRDKYLPLAQEITELWGVDEVMVVPIILGATGEIPKELFKSFKTLNVPAYIFVAMQKSVILATCNIVRKVFNVK